MHSLNSEQTGSRGNHLDQETVTEKKRKQGRPGITGLLYHPGCLFFVREKNLSRLLPSKFPTRPAGRRRPSRREKERSESRDAWALISSGLEA